MSTATNHIDKLQESFQKRDEAKVQLSEYFLIHQQDLPQELINAWGGFERLELEGRTIETEAIEGIEPELQKAQSVISKFKMANRVVEVLLFLGMLGCTIFIISLVCTPRSMSMLIRERKIAQKSNTVTVGELNE